MRRFESRYKVAKNVPVEKLETRLMKLSSDGWTVKQVAQRATGRFVIIGHKTVRVFGKR